MSKQLPPKKRVTVPAAPQPRQPQRQAQAAPQRRERKPSIFDHQEMIYTRRNYQIMLGGLALITLGMVLMLGGRMPSADVWDPNVIYSFRRITLAPISILLGFGVILYGIFYQDGKNDATETGFTPSTPDSTEEA
jgi:hypothetical protein